MHTRNWSSLGE